MNDKNISTHSFKKSYSSIILIQSSSVFVVFLHTDLHKRKPKNVANYPFSTRILRPDVETYRSHDQLTRLTSDARSLIFFRILTDYIFTITEINMAIFWTVSPQIEL